MYELHGPPFKLDKRDPYVVLDGSGERIKLMGDSREILRVSIPPCQNKRSPPSPPSKLFPHDRLHPMGAGVSHAS